MKCSICGGVCKVVVKNGPSGTYQVCSSCREPIYKHWDSIDKAPPSGYNSWMDYLENGLEKNYGQYD